MALRWSFGFFLVLDRLHVVADRFLQRGAEVDEELVVGAHGLCGEVDVLVRDGLDSLRAFT